MKVNGTAMIWSRIYPYLNKAWKIALVSTIVSGALSAIIQILMGRSWNVVPASGAGMVIAAAISYPVGKILLYYVAKAYFEKTRADTARREIETIIDSLPAAFIIRDIDGRFLMANRDFERVIGIGRDQIIGNTLHGLLATELVHEMDELNQQVFDKDKTLNFEKEIINLDGKSHNLLFTKAPLHDEAGKVYAVIGIATDISQLKRLQNDLEQAKQTAEEAKRAAEQASSAKSTFLTNMSHELRTPMNAILGFSEMLAHDPGVSAKQMERIKIINKSGEHLLSIINDVLDMSKIEAGRIELEIDTFDLPSMLIEIGDMFADRARMTGLDFGLNLASDLVRCVQGDAGKIRQILINLLGNAIKFTSHGEITLGARSESTENPGEIRLILKVKDTGCGIHPSQQEAMFEPFTQVSEKVNSQKGSGLGLTIIRQFIRMMDGEITVESEPEHGSCFTVRLLLPLGNQQELPVVTTNLDEMPRVLGLKPGQTAWRILVVEDNPVNRQLLIEHLDQVGFDTREVENGAEAITAFENWQPHLIWMDMRMPVVDGFNAVSKIRQMPGGQDAVIIAITANAYRQDLKRLESITVDDVVAKPYRVATIFQKMQQYLGVQYIFDDPEASKPAATGTTLDVNMLRALPPPILKQISSATVALDIETMQKIIIEIQEIDSTTAEGLRSQVDNYEFSRINTLLQEVLDESDRS